MKIELDDNEIAALIVFPIALLGTFCNWTICFKSRSTIAFRNSFGRLTTAQSFGDASHSTLFLTVFVPMAFFNIESLKHNSRHLGHVLLIAYDISTYLHLCISINRFYSIVFPLIYEKVFTRNFTLFLIIISYSLAIFPSFYLYVYNNCQFYIDDYYWGFVFLNNTVCQKISWYADYIKYNVVIATIVTLDSVTVTKMHWNNEKISNKSSTSYALRRRREINFLKQACFQALVALWELINYFVITPRLSLSHKWLRFLSSTVSWVMVHVVDGVITITCNKEFHKIFKKRPVVRKWSLGCTCKETSRDNSDLLFLVSRNYWAVYKWSRSWESVTYNAPESRWDSISIVCVKSVTPTLYFHPLITMLKTFEIAKLITKTGFFLTFLVNLLLIYLTVFYTKTVTRIYRKMIIIFATCCILFSALEVTVRPGLYNFNGGFIYFSLNDGSRFSQQSLQLSLVLYASFYAALLSFVSIQFIFRYWTLTTSRYLKLFHGWKIIFWAFYILLSAPYGVLMYVCLQPDEYSDEYMREEMLNIYSYGVKDVARFIEVAYDGKGRVRWTNMGFLFVGNVFLTLTYIIIVYCSFQMSVALKTQSSLISSKRQRIEKQFFKALIVQIVLPTILLSFPSFLVLTIPLLDVKVQFQSGLIFAAFSLYPPMDSLAMMFIITEYRHCTRRAIGDFKSFCDSESKSPETTGRIMESSAISSTVL